MINYSKHMVSAAAVKFWMWAEPAYCQNPNVNMNAVTLPQGMPQANDRRMLTVDSLSLPHALLRQRVQVIK